VIVFPAIDLLGGKVVRLAQGDYGKVTVYAENPVAQAREFAVAGAEWLHVVDLDGARDGAPGNTEAISHIVREVDLPVQVGGGIRTLEALGTLAEAGVARMVLGTKLATDPEFAREAVSRFGGESIVAGVDARDGMVAVEGWREGITTSATDLVAELRSLGIRHLVYTDISRDGMRTGVDIDAYEAIAETAGFPVIASGGVSTLDDFRELAATGPDVMEGAITGRALYEGAFKLKHAIRAARGEY